MMIHVRVDDEDRNDKRRFACGIGPELPSGDVYFFASELGARRSDCPGCNPGGPYQLGIPLSQVTGADLDRIAREWRGEDDI